MKKIVIAKVVNDPRGFELFQVVTDRYGDEDYYHFHDTICRTYLECVQLCRENGYNLENVRPVEF